MYISNGMRAPHENRLNFENYERASVMIICLWMYLHRIQKGFEVFEDLVILDIGGLKLLNENFPYEDTYE